MAMSLAQLDAAMQALNERLAKMPGARVRFDERMDVSWIFHDSALEGLVLTYTELRSATDERVISDSSLISFYDEIRNHKKAIELVRELVAKRKYTLSLETIKKLHGVLAVEEEGGGEEHYRRDHPIHRLYFHEILSPDKISYRMRRLATWLGSDESRAIHPVRAASLAHLRLMQIFPWTKNSGKVARLLMNLMLMREGYIPIIIHSIDRQRYYESLRVPAGLEEEEDDDEADVLTALVMESLETGVIAAGRMLDEWQAEARRVRAA